MTTSPAALDPTTSLAEGVHRALPALFEEHALRAPEHLAVADSERQWTYGELRTRANQLAHWLRARGVGPDQIVAIHAERNAFTVAAMLGVLASGAAFMIIDADYPIERIRSHVRVGKPVAWIDAAPSRAAAAGLTSADGLPAHCIALAKADAELSSLPSSAPEGELPSRRTAYVVFTSGTTGVPKAAPATHGALAHFVEWQAATFELGARDRFSALSGLAHLPFTRDVLTALSVGASIYVPRQELRLEADELAAWLSKNAVTVAHLTPSLAQILTLARSPSLDALRCVFFAGEPLRGELVDAFRRVAPKTRLVNFYGASETAQSISYLVIEKSSPGIMPIGRGIDRTQLLLLKDDETLAAVGEEGEICVRTPYLATAYLNGEPGGFGVNPFTKDPADRVYRTGDRGRYLPDGSVQILGRRDHQVKVRGFRVELGDVEEALRKHPGVRQAAVVLREENNALVGYVVGDVDTTALLHSLRTQLPDYMVPSAVVKLDAFPLTPNGKIDRRAFPAPQIGGGAKKAEDEPVNEIENAISEVWKDVLGADEVARHDNFFDLGGHSLNATQVAARLREFFNVDVPVRTIFDAPTVAELAVRILDSIVKSAPSEALASALAKADASGKK